MELSGSQKIALEMMVDSSSLTVVVEMLAVIAHDKAEHIRTNWQDRVTAAPWNRAGNEIERCVTKLQTIGV